MITWNRRRVKCCAPVRVRAHARMRTANCPAKLAEPIAVRSTPGFTLLEVLVAVAIVAIALVTFMGLHLHSLDDTIRAQDLTTAVLLAQGKMATMGEFPDTGEADGKFEGPELERFQWATAVTERTLDALGGGKPVTVRHLEVTVRWADGQQIRHYTLEAYGVR
jgi:general secretion pathway protein I